MAKTREALFSSLEARGIDWEQANVLDLFAGSGSLGFEAISRGAKKATLVDNGTAPFNYLLKNKNALALDNEIILFRLDVLKFLRASPHLSYDIVFIDPPYRKNLVSPVLRSLIKNNWLQPDALVVAEVEKDANLPDFPELSLITQKIFGQTILDIWKML